jgi:hypothetical protein
MLDKSVQVHAMANPLKVREDQEADQRIVMIRPRPQVVPTLPAASSVTAPARVSEASSICRRDHHYMPKPRRKSGL